MNGKIEALLMSCMTSADAAVRPSPAQIAFNDVRSYFLLKQRSYFPRQLAEVRAKLNVLPIYRGSTVTVVSSVKSNLTHFEL